MTKVHNYKVKVDWTGNTGGGTSDYTAYDRSYSVYIDNKPVIYGSSDPAFRGDRLKYNPEELLLSALSSCHMLWYLHLCSQAGVVVLDYSDYANGRMEESADGSGKFIEVMLNPVVKVAESSMLEKAMQLHRRAGELCFIANSVSFPVHHAPVCKVLGTDLSDNEV